MAAAVLFPPIPAWELTPALPSPPHSRANRFFAEALH